MHSANRNDDRYRSCETRNTIEDTIMDAISYWQCESSTIAESKNTFQGAQPLSTRSAKYGDNLIEFA